MHFKYLKILFATAYTLLAMEGLLRIMAPVPMMPRYVTAAPYGVRSNMPNRVYSHSTAEYRIQIRTNSKGIRSDREIPYEKPATRKRVVLLGDSFGMGYGVDADDMFTTKMTHYLKEKYNIDVEVVNLSTSGLGNAEELVVLLNEGFKYAPDLVILAWHYTDLSDNLRSNLYELVDGKLVEKRKSYLPGVKERQFLDKIPFYNFLSEHSQIYNIVRNWAGKKAKKWYARVRLMDPNLKKNIEKQNWATRDEYEMELTIALLKRIELECRMKNSHFLVLDIPFKISRTEFVSKFPLKDAIHGNPLAVVSPIEYFRKKSGQQIYWEKGDGHFTPLGCDLVGKALTDYIHDHDLLAGQ